MKKRKFKIKPRRFIKISLTKFFLITILFLTIAQIILSNSLATHGNDLETLNTQIRAVELENKKLTTEIAQKISLSDILLKAKERGFIREPKVVNLSGDGVVALKP